MIHILSHNISTMQS